jgi:superfamily II DNA/RNA helicase
MRTEEPETFSALGVSPDLVDVLHNAGMTTPFPVQRLCIPDALAGRDVCGKAKTGSGKTLAFGLPLAERVKPADPRKPTGLVLVPTRELAVQVAEVIRPLLAARGLRLVAVYGGAQMGKQIAALEAGAEVVVATPGRLIDLIDRKVADLTAVGMVVLDEADRMADMGFMPQVEWLLRHTDGRHQTLLFSATLDGGIQGLVDRYQEDPVFHEVGSAGATVERMAHRFLLVHEMDQPRVAAAITRSAARTLVFVNTKRAADRVARALVARGLDIDELDIVIQYDPPPDPKTYLHRAGRTARAGAAGLAVTLVLWNQELEVRRLKRRLDLDEPIVEMFSNDERLADLTNWNPAAEGAA